MKTTVQDFSCAALLNPNPYSLPFALEPQPTLTLLLKVNPNPAPHPRYQCARPDRIQPSLQYPAYISYVNRYKSSKLFSTTDEMVFL
jgi:hypothetical protein